MISLKRLVDANFNRAREGLRVLEDLARFVLNDKRNTAKIKGIRHRIAAILISPAVSKFKLLESRDSKFDVGKRSVIFDKKKLGFHDLAAANFKRVEESLRVLEECSKVFMPAVSVKFQVLRFDVYELEKSIIKKFQTLRHHRSKKR